MQTPNCSPSSFFAPILPAVHAQLSSLLFLRKLPPPCRFLKATAATGADAASASAALCIASAIAVGIR